ncbi:MAG TPA: SDR family NAD(P)-dependent oxidoreductase [Thermomicrobiales bacterium]|jgi:3-oxoacyl-[acyl-carrier protein] reductase
MQRVAIVTGAARGIGLAVAQRLIADGLQVALLDRDEAAANAAAATLGEGAQPFICDIADSASVNATVAAVVARWGRIDVLVNNAGIVGPNKPLIEVSDEEWARVVAINLNGAFYCCRAAAPEMLKGDWGRIVNIASIAGKEGNPNLAGYSATKAAIIGLTKSLGKELALTGVRVNAIAPAVIETEILEQATPETRAYMVSRIPMGRPGRSEEVAALVSWLASEECSFSTGAVYDISGGRATY